MNVETHSGVVHLSKVVRNPFGGDVPVRIPACSRAVSTLYAFPTEANVTCLKCQARVARKGA